MNRSDRSYGMFAVALVAVLGVASARADEPPSWPATRAGALARGWVAAFDAGADSMRAFTERNVAAKSLAERGVPARIERYRELRDQYGRLSLMSVEESAADHVSVKLLDSDAHARTFRFSIETAPPHKLVKVEIVERSGHMGGWFGGFHH